MAYSLLSLGMDDREDHPEYAASFIPSSTTFEHNSLNIQGMLKNHKLARAVSDAGWGQFLTILKHKAEGAGVQFKEVSARGTSQTCPACGAVVKKTLAQRKHVCPCGYSAHRDQAAAQVILARGLLAGMRPVGLNADVGQHGPRSRLL
ncbi:RNA-guided endonuclease InsQ/TnpB family protein [Candidatus Methylocalor cossyra]